MSQMYRITSVTTNVTNTPLHCGCLNSKSAKNKYCRNAVENVYVFQDGRLKYSCNIKSHMRSILGSITTDDVVNVYTRKKNTTTEIPQYHKSISNFHCFQVLTHSDMFYRPFTQSDALHFNMKEATSNYITHLKRFNKSFPYEEIIKMTQVLKDNTNNEASTDKPSQEHIDNARKYLFEWTVAKSTLRWFRKEYEDAKSAYKSLETLVLPWCHSSSHVECTICMSDVSESNGGHVECGHAFHNKCLKLWIDKDKNSCPTCRSCISCDKFIITTC